MACTYMFHTQTVIQTWLFWPATAIMGYSVFLLKYVSATVAIVARIMYLNWQE